MPSDEDLIRDVVHRAASLLPRIAAVVEQCRTEADPGQGLARACGALVREYGALRDILANMQAGGEPDHHAIRRVDTMLYLQQRIVSEAAHLAFRPRSEHWARVARSFGDGLTTSADELLALAARYSRATPSVA